MVTEAETLANVVYARYLKGYHEHLGLELDDLRSEAWLHAANGLTGGRLYWKLRRYMHHWLDRDDLTQFTEGDELKTFWPNPNEGDTAWYPELCAQLQPLLAQLTPQRLAIINAIYREGMTPNEAATVLGIPAASVHRQRYLAVEQLREWANGGVPKPVRGYRAHAMATLGPDATPQAIEREMARLRQQARRSQKAS